MIEFFKELVLGKIMARLWWKCRLFILKRKGHFLHVDFLLLCVLVIIKVN